MLKGTGRAGEDPTLKKNSAIISGFDEIAQCGLPAGCTAWEADSERARDITVPKFRGMAYSRQVRESAFTGSGIDPADSYLDSEGGSHGEAAERLGGEPRGRYNG